MQTPCTHDLCLRPVARRSRVRSGRRLFRRRLVALRSDKAAFTGVAVRPRWSVPTPWPDAVSFRSYSLRCDGFRRGLLANVRFDEVW